MMKIYIKIKCFSRKYTNKYLLVIISIYTSSKYTFECKYYKLSSFTFHEYNNIKLIIYGYNEIIIKFGCTIYEVALDALLEWVDLEVICKIWLYLVRDSTNKWAYKIIKSNLQRTW